MTHRIHRLLGLFMAGCILSSASLAQSASQSGKTCFVSKFKFENEGGYELSMFKVGAYQFDGFLSQGQARTWDLKKANLAEGSSVFLTYRLDQGDGYTRKGCKKQGTTLKYHPRGTTWGYWSKGTTKFNNRCRFRNNPCVQTVGDESTAIALED